MTSILSATFVVLKDLNLTKRISTKKRAKNGEPTQIEAILGRQKLVFKKTAVVETATLSTRMPYMTDSNGNSVEGGALNANYTTVDAVAKLCNTLGRHGYVYGRDFIWQDQGWTEDMEDAIVVEYNDPKIKTLIGVAHG